MPQKALPIGALPIAAVIDFVLTVSSISSGAGALYMFAGLAETGVLDKDSATVVLSLAAPVVTMLLYVSPIPVVAEAVRTLNAQNLPTQVFQSQIMCNVLSISYGIQVSNAAILVTNMFGLACQVTYLSIDHYIRVSSGWLLYCLKLMTALNTGLYFFTIVSPLNMLGHAITIFNVILFVVPLTKLGTILRTRNASSLPAGMAVISTCNNAIWTLYALMIQDPVVLLPSILAYILSLFQILVILWCKGHLPFNLGYLLLLCRDSQQTYEEVEMQRKDIPTMRELKENSKA